MQKLEIVFSGRWKEHLTEPDLFEMAHRSLAISC